MATEPTPDPLNPEMSGPLMPERQRTLTARPRAFTISQAQELIRYALIAPHTFYSITINWRKSGTKRVRNVDDLDHLYSPDTVTSVLTNIIYDDDSTFSLTLGYPNVLGVSRPTGGTHADRTLESVQLELDKLPYRYIKPKILTASNLLAMAAYLGIYYLAQFIFEQVLGWNAIAIALLAVPVGWAVVIPTLRYVNRRNPPFRAWLSHREYPATKWSREQIIGIATLIATVAIPFVIAFAF